MSQEVGGPGKPAPLPPGLGLGTRAVHAAREGAPLGPHGERAATAPLHQTANYVYEDAAGAAQAAAGAAFIYTRHGNPTVEALARAVADLEGAEAGLAFSSGMAAVSTALFAAAGDDPGAEVLASEGIYGGSTELLTGLGPRFGVRARFVPAWDLAAVEAAICLLYTSDAA